MDIAALSMAMANSSLKANVGIALTSKAMDQMEQQGNQLVEMIQQSAPPVPHPALGNRIDVRA